MFRYGPLTREIYVLLGDSQPGGIAGSESTTDSVTVATPDSTTEASAVAVTGEPEASTTPARTCITSSMEGYECMQKVRKLVTFVADKKTSLLKFVGGHSQLPRKLRMKTGENFTWLIHPYFAFHAVGCDSQSHTRYRMGHLVAILQSLAVFCIRFPIDDST